MSDYTPEQIKRCARCNSSYPRTAEYFHRNRTTNDGLEHYCKQCRRDHSKKRRNEYPDKVATENRRWRKNNPTYCQEETFKQKRREYKIGHRDQSNKAQNLRRKLRPEVANKSRLNSRRWRAANLERARQYCRTYNKLHPDIVNTHARNRRARHAAAEGSHTRNDIQRIGESQHWRCWWCGKDCKERYHVDHRIPLNKGGSNKPANLVIACPFCNESKHDKLPHEWSNRLL